MAIPRNLANFATKLDTGGFINGSVGAPSITFSSDTITGIYRVGTSNIGFSAGGVRFFQSAYTRGTIPSSSDGTGNPETTFIGLGQYGTISSTSGSAAVINVETGGAYRLDACPYQLKITAPGRGSNTAYTAPAANGIVGIISTGDYGGNGVAEKNVLYIENNTAVLRVDGGATGVKVVSNSYSTTYGIDSLCKPGDPNGGGVPVAIRARVDNSNGANDNSAPVCLMLDNGPSDNITKINGGQTLAVSFDRRSGSTSRQTWSFRRNTTSNEVGSISTTNTATTYSTSSDYRLKENPTPMTGALAKVSRLKPCTFTWKIDGSVGEGFIAHELQEVVPQAVTGEKDAVEEIKDGEGNTLETKPKYQSVDTSFLVATLTAAIQEQQVLIETLTARVAALEAK
jgi:hypothetical protein